ncbi:MAG: hypothetical protein ACOY3P_04545 [Planctomycetota bacterium]
MILAGLAVALTSCRTDPNISLLERELRLQEDQIYELRECIADYEAQLDSCQRENAYLRKRADGQGDDMPVAAPRRSGNDRPIPTEAVTTPPQVALPGEALPPGAIPETLLPSGVPEVPEHLREPTERPRDVQRPTAVPDGAEAILTPEGRVLSPGEPEPAGPSLGVGMLGQFDEPTLVEGTTSDVERITLNRLLTGGYKGRRTKGSEGVLVVIEPRDAEGRIVRAPADLSIVVLDPAMEGEAARIARWDFSAEETAQLFQQNRIGPGIQVEVPWPNGAPEHDDLHLFVRYVTADGRKLQADRPIRAQLSGLQLEQWTGDASEPHSDPALQSERPTTPWKRATSAANLLAQQPSGSAKPESRTPDGDSEPAEPPVAERTATASQTPPREGARTAIARPVWSPERR